MSSVRLLVTVALLTSTAACGSQSPGRPTAGTETVRSTSGNGSSAATSVSPTSGSSGPGLADVEPCALLTDPELTQLGFPPGSQDTAAGNPRCSWDPAGAAVVDLTLWATRGLADLNTANRTVTELRIGSHQGRRLEHNVPGLCDIDIAVTEKSSVTVGALHDQTQLACALAEQVARLVEPKLSRG